MTQADVLRVAIALVLIVAAILLAAWLARRSGLLQRQGGGVLRIVASLSVGPRQNIAVVQVRDTWVVVGITPNGMTPLHTLPAEPVAEPGSPQAAADAASIQQQQMPATFATALAKRFADALNKRP
ncbi:flagellar biosynthetic protein FliO [Bordetella genomosp. 13]|uniref:Flagellar protein n=1 Tax=Bordetella genomosp. 13 TaxID=463040 RepID=A0A1W6ZAA9_9BORD|nr:flagellar biosynthetic protein FliO [Bordetella genomosp. 13]ARP94301.1 flagellar biosynthetic protein FliO [Bordetella genomosp. 13]